MDPMRVLIVDDEPIVREDLRALLGNEPDMEVVGEARDGIEALDLISRLSPDALFLDVQMPQLGGLEVAAALEPGTAPLIVLVTAYDHYALPAFDLHAVDYLLKPFDGPRLQRAVTRLRQRRAGGAGGGLPVEVTRLAGRGMPSLERIAVRRSRGVVVIEVAAIIWCEAADNYVRLHLAQGSELTRRTMAEVEELLDPMKFRRVSRSAMVNLAHVRAMEPAGHGDWNVLLSTGRRIQVSRNYRESFLAALGGVA